jgi:YVTN family beta-propeller protein
MPNGLIGRGLAIALLGAARIAAADTVYVSNEKDNTITVVDGSSLAAVKTIPVGQRPRGILLSKDAKSLYICASDSDHIEVLDLARNAIARTLPSGPDPEYFALDPAGKLLYVANEDSTSSRSSMSTAARSLPRSRSGWNRRERVSVPTENTSSTPPKRQTWRM